MKTAINALMAIAVAIAMPALHAKPTFSAAPFLMKDQQVQQIDGRTLYFVHLEGAPVPVRARAYATERSARNRLQLNSSANLEYREQLRNKQREMESSIRKATGGNALVKERLQLALNALLVAMKPQDIERVRSLPGVTRVEPVTMRRIQTDRGPEHIRATDVWAGLPGFVNNMGEGVIIGVIDTGIRADHPAFADIGGDGYDHTNPLGNGVYLGDCIDDPTLCNDKLIGIVSYDDITYAYGGERPENGWDYNGHGTHVASTAAGNVLHNVPVYNFIGEPSEYALPRVSGVAPHANIVSYQVCFPASGGCMSQLAALSVEHAIEHGVDVFNYSIGGGMLSPWSTADAQAFLSARAAGIHVATSAGNSGPGPSTVGSPGNAPWLTSVAAYTHDRDYEDPALNNFSGGLDPPAAPLHGKGLTYGYTGPVVKAEDFGDAQCLKPFAAGTFAGEIVVCERGDIARVEKGHNVLAGGAGGMILTNLAGGDNDLVADPHELPTIHVDADTGQALLNWLAEGVGHTATISAAGIIENDGIANIAGTFTSRGPVLPYSSVPSPHVAAPGVNIYAAWVDDAPFRDHEYTAPYAFSDGTSMSSPHVAGALALLKAVHPSWTPAEAQSAMMTSAVVDTSVDSDGTPSTMFDAGSGMLDVAAALNAGLVFDENENNYLSANPEFGGDPRKLNIAALADDSCLLSCSWTRTVRATRAATWTASVPAGIAAVSVEPATFTLAAGQQQTLKISISANNELPTDWVHERIALTPNDASISPVTLPMAVFFKAGTMPASFVINARRDIGTADIHGFRSIESDALQLNPMGLIKAQKHEAYLKGDTTPTQTFDTVDGVVHTVTVNVNTKTRTLVAEILEAESPDLDLFIAKDLDLNGKPNGYELYYGGLCVSGSPTSDERCVIQDPEPGVYWIAVHNYEASTPDALDRHLLSVAVIEDVDSGVTVTPPSSVDTNEPFAVTASWNQPMSAGESWYATIAMGSDAGHHENIGRTLLRIDRVEDDFDVVVSRTHIVAGETLTYTWTVAEIPTDGVAQEYVVSTTLPEGFAAFLDETGVIEGNQATWTFTQAPGAAARTGTLTLQSTPSENGFDHVQQFTHQTITGGAAGKGAPTVTVAGSPVARIDGETSASRTAAEGDSIEFDVSGSTGSNSNDTLFFEWQQLEGPTAAITASGDGKYQLKAPSVGAASMLRYQLKVSNGAVAGLPAQLEVIITDKPKSKGGGSGGPWLLGLLFMLVWRQRKT